MKSRRFPKAVVAAIDEGQTLGIRAGMEPHRVIGIDLGRKKSRATTTELVPR